MGRFWASHHAVVTAKPSVVTAKLAVVTVNFAVVTADFVVVKVKSAVLERRFREFAPTRLKKACPHAKTVSTARDETLLHRR
jgi:hypothetical protein